MHASTLAWNLTIVHARAQDEALDAAVAACTDAGALEAVWAQAVDRTFLSLMGSLARSRPAHAAWHRRLGDALAGERLHTPAARAYMDCAAAAAGAPVHAAFAASATPGVLLHSDAVACLERAAESALDGGNVTGALWLRRGLRDAAAAVGGPGAAPAARAYAELALATGALGAGSRALVRAEVLAVRAAAADARARRSQDTRAWDVGEPRDFGEQLVRERALPLFWSRLDGVALASGHLLRHRGREAAVRDAFARNCGACAWQQRGAWGARGGGGARSTHACSCAPPRRHRRALEQHDRRDGAAH